MTDSRTLQQARYIFSVGKMLRQHVFSSLSRFESTAEDCRHSDLSMAQFNLIITVRNQGEITLTELAEKLDVSPPSVSVMVERLVERGLLVRERSRTDRRKVIIQVSPDEDHQIAALEDQIVATFVELVDELGPKTASKWYEVLEQVEKVLKKRQSGRGQTR